MTSLIFFYKINLKQNTCTVSNMLVCFASGNTPFCLCMSSHPWPIPGCPSDFWKKADVPAEITQPDLKINLGKHVYIYI